MRVCGGILLTFVGGLLWIGVASASAADLFDPCDERARSCADVSVPLDRSGAVPGVIRIRIDQRRAENAARPPLLIVGGAAGVASLVSFDPRLIGAERRRRDVVGMDLRGTGASGPIVCPALERAGRRRTADAAAACASRLGASRGLYTVRDSAQDVEAVRQSIGAERIAIVGVSHGARVALAYARRYPTRVDRLVLDSPTAPAGEDALRRPSFAAVPSVVHSRCRLGACRLASPTPVADVVTLARRAERRPLRGRVVDGTGRARPAAVRPFDVLELVSIEDSSSFGPVDGRAIPGIVRNARHGDLAPLLRTQQDVEMVARSFVARRIAWLFSVGARAASYCEESVFPWPRSGPLSARSGQARAFVDGLAGDPFRPFGPRAALGSDILELCRRWPIASAPPEPPTPLPPIPTLLLVGERNLEAPVSGAKEVARLIPGARLLELPGVSGEALYSRGGCVGRAISAFLAGGVPSECRRVPRWRDALPPPPMSLDEVAPEPGATGRPGRTLAAVRLTLLDSARMLPSKMLARIQRVLRRRVAVRRFSRLTVPVGALRRGRVVLRLRDGRLALRGASYVPGVRIAGLIEHFAARGRSRRSGVIRVSGPSAAAGTLIVNADVLSGRLGGRDVSTRLRGPALQALGVGEPSPAALAGQALRRR